MTKQARGSRRGPWRGLICVVGASVALSPLAFADSVVLAPVADVTLIEDPAGGFASGSGPAIFAGRIASTLQSVRRALVRFDIAVAVPPGSKIEAVRLRLHLAQANSGPTPARLYRVTQSWGEGASFSQGGGGDASQTGDATWLHRFHDDVFWTNPGGDFDPALRAETIVDQAGYYTWGTTPGMTQDVQSWLDDPASNNGWMLAGDETRTQTAKRYDSREIADSLLRPALEIVYTPPCLPDAQGPGFWRQACLAGIDAGAAACAADTFDAIGLPGLDACSAVLVSVPPTCDARAARKIAVLVLNVCTGRLQSSCPVPPQGSLCDSSTTGDRLFELGALLASGECRRAAACSGLPD